mmetsp:Transcript_37286/g.88623  ORF Transcript_37286/g.88623 Transcript_37286/m.88623 type:complete len:240 (+) Transcript_37286:591-1310(+)
MACGQRPAEISETRASSRDRMLPHFGRGACSGALGPGGTCVRRASWNWHRFLTSSMVSSAACTEERQVSRAASQLSLASTHGTFASRSSASCLTRRTSSALASGLTIGAPWAARGNALPGRWPKGGCVTAGVCAGRGRTTPAAAPTWGCWLVHPEMAPSSMRPSSVPRKASMSPSSRSTSIRSWLTAPISVGMGMTFLRATRIASAESPILTNTHSSSGRLTMTASCAAPRELALRLPL